MISVVLKNFRWLATRPPESMFGYYIDRYFSFQYWRKVSNIESGDRTTASRLGNQNYVANKRKTAFVFLKTLYLGLTEISKC